MKIAINIQGQYFAIEAERITIAGIPLAIHRTPLHPKHWNVTDPVSGYAVLSKAKTQEQARYAVAIKFGELGVERVKDKLSGAPEAPPVEGLPEWKEEKRTATPAVEIPALVDLIAKAVGGLTDREKAAVSRALNSRTGQLKAKSPSAFGDADERLACAAWQGIQPNGFKTGLVSLFAIGHHAECQSLYTKLSAVKWPAAFDKDKLALVSVGVW